MDYVLSVEQFNDTFAVKENGTKLKHFSGKRFKLFPFITHPNSIAIMELSCLVGRFLCQIEGISPKALPVGELVDKLKEDTELEPGTENLFYEVISHLFFDNKGNLRPTNLQMLEQVPCEESSEKRIAEYLVDVLGDKSVLKMQIEEAKRNLLQKCNVIERLVLSKLEAKEDPIKSTPYFRITNAVQNKFEADFEFVLESQNRTRDYLIPLLEFYYFTYTAQACLQLNRFFDGERESNIPLYFCLEWEKTSQSRSCFTEGWIQLQSAIEKIFAHAVTLEILNQTEEHHRPVDYIILGELAQQSPEDDSKIARQIEMLTECYRNAIPDCPEMIELQKNKSLQGETATEVRFLFESVKTQFENTGRERAYTSYARKFESYCHKYLKNRGRSGMMLNLSEETLILLTKICIKDQEQMRLNDVFGAFENRGVFLDNISKEQIASYYEMLNLIEKKSDSGDAKYVKRIL